MRHAGIHYKSINIQGLEKTLSLLSGINDLILKGKGQEMKKKKHRIRQNPNLQDEFNSITSYNYISMVSDQETLFVDIKID